MAAFSLGELVHHKRYDYRGVVVGADGTCQASEEWYQHNRSQPDRRQPWYHVVVDGGSHMTYVAESNLERSSSPAPVQNPMLGQFNLHFHAGRYYPQSLN